MKKTQQRRTLFVAVLGIILTCAIVVLSVRLGERIRRADRHLSAPDPVAFSSPDSRAVDVHVSDGATGGGPRGVVVDEQGVGVADAVVAAVGATGSSERVETLLAEGRLTKTDKSGEFQLERLREEPGWVLATRHPGYRPHYVEMSVEEMPGPYRIVLTRGRSIRGVVFDQAGNPASGVRLVALGHGATHADGLPDVFPGARTTMQATVSDSRGGFTIDGLDEQWYLIDVVAPGLVISPVDRIRRLGGKVLLPGSGTKYAEAGQDNVRITVLSIGVVDVKTVDEQGTPLLGAHVAFRRESSFEFVNQGVSSTASPMVASGTAVRAGADSPGQSVFGQVLAFRAYPVPSDAKCNVKVSASGYRVVEAEAPIRPAGSRSDPFEIRLSRTSGPITGALRLTLQDRRGTRITDTRVALVFARPDEERPRVAHPVWFGSDGVSEALALAPGEYTVCAAAPRDSPLETVVVNVMSGRTSEATLTLADWGGVDLTVRDEEGLPLVDHGIWAEREFVADIELGEHGHTVRGIPLQIPGLGGGTRQLFRLGAGQWRIRITHHGYEPAEERVECEAGILKPLQIVMKRTRGNWR